MTAQLSFGLEMSYRCAYELWGTTGRIIVERAFTPPPDHAPLIRLHQAGRTEEVRVEPANQFAAVVRAFVRAVRDRVPAWDLQGAAIVRQAELIDHIRASAVRCNLVASVNQPCI